MPNYRRLYVAGGTYFLTVVTAGRKRFLTTEWARACLHAAIKETRDQMPFTVPATVLLPDHWHLLMSLPVGDSDFSARIKGIKERFTRAVQQEPSLDRVRYPYWQPRFWEHLVCDEDDHERCFDYIHYNPVKHGCVSRVRDYSWSSFHRAVRDGVYTLDWGQGEIRDVEGAEWD